MFVFGFSCPCPHFCCGRGYGEPHNTHVLHTCTPTPDVCWELRLEGPGISSFQSPSHSSAIGGGFASLASAVGKVDSRSERGSCPGRRPCISHGAKEKAFSGSSWDMFWGGVSCFVFSRGLRGDFHPHYHETINLFTPLICMLFSRLVH